MESVSDTLCGCPKSETIFIDDSRIHQDPISEPVSLPHLRNIEFGAYEDCSGLVTHPQSPKNTAAGFRMLSLTNLDDGIPVMATI